MAKEKFGSYGIEYKYVLVGTFKLLSYLCRP